MFENSDEEIDFEIQRNVENPTAIIIKPPPVIGNNRIEENIVEGSPKIVVVSNRKVVKRKFPGPAGILPECRNYDSLSVDDNVEKNPPNLSQIPCTQTTISVFNERVWIMANNEYNKLIDMYNIRWIKQRANRDELINEKAPFLAAIVQNIECFEDKSSIVNVTLKDETDTIEGTVLHKLYEEYADSFTTGSVIILKQFGVLTTGYNSNHYLTITSNNLVAIYHKTVESEDVKTVVIQSVTQDELLKEFSRDNNNPNNNKRRKCDFTSNTIKEKENETENITVNCSQSQLLLKAKPEHTKIWQDLFDDVDTDALFDDF